MVALLMNKATGEPMTADGQIVSVEKTFVPEEANGSVDMEITVPGLDLEGVSLVVFESLYHNDVEVALHADLNDEGQTVTYGNPDFPLPPTGSYEEPEQPGPAEEDAEPGLERGPGSDRGTSVVRPLAQTGDVLGLAAAGLAAMAVVSGVVLALARKRRSAR